MNIIKKQNLIKYNNCRLFYTNSIKSEEKKIFQYERIEEDSELGSLEFNVDDLNKAQKWIKQNKVKLFTYPQKPDGSLDIQRASKVTYLGGELPFPMNPFFLPTKLTKSETKNLIFDQYQRDPIRNSARNLSVKHKLSIRRIEAIIKLKKLQLEWSSQEIPLQEDFQQGMEVLVGTRNDLHEEDIETITPHLGKPIVKIVNEGEKFDPIDAAQFLNKQPFKKFMDNQDKKKSMFKEEVLSLKTFPNKSQIKNIRFDEFAKNKRWDFMFVDIDEDTPLKDREMTIRQKDGNLRHATIEERKLVAKKLWPKMFKFVTLQ